MVDEDFIDYSQCNRVIKLLNEYYGSKKDTAHVEYPDNITAKSSEYFLYMFYSCLLDYGMRSKIYHKNLVETYKKYPNIFDPKFVIDMEEEALKKIIVGCVHPRYPNVSVKKWIDLSRKLVEYDDISDCLKRMNSFLELELFIKSIKGYGQKTGGLLIRIICEAKICNFVENVKSIPIDRHDIEISYFTGVIPKKNIGNKEIKQLSDAYVLVGNELGVNPSDVDKYLWEVGNTFCNNKNCGECPINKCCKRYLNKE